MNMANSKIVRRSGDEGSGSPEEVLDGETIEQVVVVSLFGLRY